MSLADENGKDFGVSRSVIQETFARALGREMRAQRFTNEKLERLTGIADRRIESLRSYNEEAPVYLEDFLTIATVLGPRFVSGVLAEVDMYAAAYNGEAPDKLAAQIIELAEKIGGAR